MKSKLRKDAIQNINYHRWLSGLPLLFDFQVAIIQLLEQAIFTRHVNDVYIRMRRQIGKNEVDAFVACRMLAAFQKRGGNYYRTGLTADQFEISRRRINRFVQNDPLLKLDNIKWQRGNFLQYGQATIQLASSWNQQDGQQTTKVGATVSIAGSFDEFHLMDEQTYMDTFRPMRGMTNAPFFHYGIAGQKDDPLYAGMCRALDREPEGYIFEPQKGIVQIPADYCVDVLGEDHPSSQAFLREVELYGRNNPFIQTNYLLQDIAAVAGFLTPRQQDQLLTSNFIRQQTSNPECHYVICIDIAGGNEIEFRDDRPDNVTRDDTVVLVWQVSETPKTGLFPLCNLVQCEIWRDRDLTIQQHNLLKILQRWYPYRVVIDARGIGSQIAAYLYQMYAGVTMYNATPASIDQDLNYFIGMVNNDMIKIFRDDGSWEYQEITRQLQKTQRKSNPNGYQTLGKWKGSRIDIVKAMTYLPRAVEVLKT